MSRVGLEPTIPVLGRAKTFRALNLTAIVIGSKLYFNCIIPHNIELKVLSNDLRATGKLFYIASTILIITRLYLLIFNIRIQSVRYVYLWCTCVPNFTFIASPKSSRIRHVVITDCNKLGTTALK
jgi:hypothetical protein